MLLPDVASLVDDFDLTPALGPLRVERRLAPTLDTSNGEFITASPTILRVRPWTAHTASGRALLQLPEADRSTETIEVYTKTFRFYVADDSRAADVVTYEARRWRVVIAHRYAQQGGCWFAMAQLIDTQDPDA